MFILMISGIVFIMVKSIRQFISFKGEPHWPPRHKTSISIEVFYTLIIIYCIVIIGFGLIYFVLSFYQLTLLENVNKVEETVIDGLYKSLYFSGVTLLTIGYGDITPHGIARFIAIIQALIGYVLPTTFVLKLVQLNINQNKYNK